MSAVALKEQPVQARHLHDPSMAQAMD